MVELRSVRPALSDSVAECPNDLMFLNDDGIIVLYQLFDQEGLCLVSLDDSMMQSSITSQNSTNQS
ncbi:hypothetical protein BDZ97DRAFT_1869569 [Flammula alnicola]|nr:hypothetical protein BDZ97DRAFT_1869569 [Flammula alnicola]